MDKLTTPQVGQRWWNPNEGGDVIIVDEYDGAYAVAWSFTFSKQILVSASHFGTTYVPTGD